MAVSAEYLRRLTNPMGAKAHPQAVKIAEYVVMELDRRGLSIRNLWGYDPDPDNPEHHSGRAIDFMTHKLDDSVGDVVCDILWSRRKAFGLQHLIWKQRIKSTDPRYSPGQWVLMDDRGSTTNNHRDHVHAMFYPFKGSATPVVESEEIVSKSDVERLATALEGVGYGKGGSRQSLLWRINEAYRQSTHIEVMREEFNDRLKRIEDTLSRLEAVIGRLQ